MKLIAVLPICLFAWLITSSIPEKIILEPDGNYGVKKIEYCSDEEPTYKTNGDVVVKDKAGKETPFRASTYVVRPVPNCP
jgi:hypothetical protein